jgi:hypothetical protein
MYRWFIAALIALLIAPLQATAQTAGQPQADGLPITAFYGKFSGSGIAHSEDSAYFSATVRDLDVEIQPEGNGFKIIWTTMLRQGGTVGRPESRRRTTTRTFRPTATPNVYHVAGSGNPLEGKEMSWARVEGTSLITHTMAVNDAGHYVIQSYTRTLSGNGMDLAFVRIEEGETTRTVNGRLVRERR